MEDWYSREEKILVVAQRQKVNTTETWQNKQPYDLQLNDQFQS